MTASNSATPHPGPGVSAPLLRRSGTPARASPCTAASSGCSSLHQPPELVVRHEPALASPQVLHLREQLRATRVRHVEPELLGLDADRVDAALLAQDETALGADEPGRIRLDRGWIVELR